RGRGHARIVRRRHRRRALHARPRRPHRATGARVKRAMPLTRRRRTSVRVLATALTLAALATACSDGAVLRSDDPADDVTTTAPTDRPSQSAAPTSTTST